MTRREREQVVELLRCAADDNAERGGLNGMFDSASDLGVGSRLHTEAWNALMDVQPVAEEPRALRPVDERYRRELLEAAARVEEGSWP